MQYKGNCHCGNISYQLSTQLALPDFSIRRCDCSFCTKSGARYISDPAGELSVKIQDKDKVTTYSFGTKTAAFSVCSICGSMPYATSEIDGNLYAIININTLELAEHLSRHATVMSYDEESLEERLSRRQKNWIKNVRID